MNEPIILLAGAKRLAAMLQPARAETPSSAKQVRAAFTKHRSGALWVAPGRPDLFGALAAVPTHATKKHRLLLLGRPDPSERELLTAKFEHVIVPDDGLRLLPREQLLEVIGAPNRADLFIGGAAALDSVVLVRGDLEPMVVPQAWFKARPKGPKPDFDALEIIDGGQTVRLGEYEAATDAVLYEFDAAFRRRDRERQVNEDRSLGGALRRLRLQKGLSRSAFLPEVSAKEVARLERGEVKRPHKKTLDTLARRLGVRPEELASY
jgi:hypothetical protein